MTDESDDIRAGLERIFVEAEAIERTVDLYLDDRPGPAEGLTAALTLSTILVARATVLQTLTLAQPTPEEVLEAYAQERTIDESEAQAKLREVMDILVEARSDGSRRHPAIHAALKVIER